MRMRCSMALLMVVKMSLGSQVERELIGQAGRGKVRDGGVVRWVGVKWKEVGGRGVK